MAGLSLALVGAVVISLAREAAEEPGGVRGEPSPEGLVATA